MAELADAEALKGRYRGCFGVGYHSLCEAAPEMSGFRGSPFHDLFPNSRPRIFVNSSFLP